MADGRNAAGRAAIGHDGNSRPATSLPCPGLVLPVEPFRSPLLSSYHTSPISSLKVSFVHLVSAFSIQPPLSVGRRPQDMKKPLPELPQELTDLIIDNLHSDLIALRACTLTCHSWLHRSRRHLHSRVRIGEYFVDLSRYSAPHIAQYVRELELYMVISGHTCQRVTTEPLWQMISRFPCVNTLTIRDLELPRLSPKKMAILRGLCKQLRSLTLINVEFQGADQFISFIESCEQLTHLNIPRIMFFEHHGDIDALGQSLSSLAESGSPIPGHRISSLSLGTFSSDYVTTTVELWFAALVASGSLQESMISRDACVDGPVNFDPIFSAIGTSKMDLQISCKSGTRYKNKGEPSTLTLSG